MTTAATINSAADRVWSSPEHPHWRQFGARLRAWTADVTGLDTIRVVIAPHAPAKPPAGVFNHVTRAITLDADQTLPTRTHPAGIDLRDGRDRAQHPVLCGVLAHEAGHAAHTVMREGLTGVVATWAAALEEPRMEGRVLDDQPEARSWLRASVGHILGTPNPVDAESAARTLVLLGGRVLAGVLDASDLPDLDDLTAPFLSVEQIAVVGDAVAVAVDAADGDVKALESCARRIVKVLDVDSGDGDEAGAAGSPGQAGSSGGQPGQPDDSDNPGHNCAAHANDVDAETALGRALKQVADAAQAAMRAAAGVDPGPSPAQRLKLEQAKSRAAQIVGEFKAATDAAGRHPSTSRAPLAAEVRAARALTRKLADAQLRETIVTRTASVRPPGRFRTSELVRRDSQVAAGVKPTAAPWVATRRRSTDKPPLILGIALDVSGSMHAYAGPTAVAAWAFNRAVRTLGGKVSTAIWNNAVSLATLGESSSIREPEIGGGSFGLPAALRVLGRDLNLDRSEGARVVAVVTDGDLPNADQVRGEVARLVADGVRVVWLLAPVGRAITPPAGVQVAVLDDPSRIGAIIGEAAAKALR